MRCKLCANLAITISNYRVSRFSIAGKLREIGGRVLSPALVRDKLRDAHGSRTRRLFRSASLSGSKGKGRSRGGWSKQSEGSVEKARGGFNARTAELVGE